MADGYLPDETPVYLKLGRGSGKSMLQAEFYKQMLNSVYGKPNEMKKGEKNMKNDIWSKLSPHSMNIPNIDVAKLMDQKIERKHEEEKPEEWIWVKGYKATDANMRCMNDYQFELGKMHEMGVLQSIKTCESGFHLCLKLEDVFKYRAIGEGHRYFEVEALVRKSEYEDILDLNNQKCDNGYFTFNFYNNTNKLAAKAIKLVRELTVEEVFEHTEHSDWPIDYKREAMTVGISKIKRKKEIATLINHGYSEPFATWLCGNGKYEAAFAAASQKELSMDMRCLAIFSGWD